LVKKTEGRKTLGRPKRRWEDIVKIDFSRSEMAIEGLGLSG
jgi:hypothetical protein